MDPTDPSKSLGFARDIRDQEITFIGHHNMKSSNRKSIRKSSSSAQASSPKPNLVDHQIQTKGNDSSSIKLLDFEKIILVASEESNIIDLDREDSNSNDSKIFCRYPIEENAQVFKIISTLQYNHCPPQDVIIIYNEDMIRLEDTNLLNDNLVDLQIRRLVIWKKYYDLHKLKELQGMSQSECWQHINENFISSVEPTVSKANNSDHNTSSIYAFSSMFYQKLTETSPAGNHQLVKNWTKNVDLFQKEYILIPINLSNHWSLVCLVRPGMIQGQVADISE
jgi:hypothetical protein